MIGAYLKFTTPSLVDLHLRLHSGRMTIPSKLPRCSVVLFGIKLTLLGNSGAVKSLLSVILVLWPESSQYPSENI